MESNHEKKLFVGMVGLPARGKTYISLKLTRYFNFLGYKAKTFNIGKHNKETFLGDYRRLLVGATKERNFFDPENVNILKLKAKKDAVKDRKMCALYALKDLIKFFKNEGGDIAFFDGTNSTKERRKLIRETLDKEFGNYSLLWIESICEDPQMIEKNIVKAKIGKPDFVNMDPSEAVKEFKIRTENYEKSYEKIEDNEYPEISYIKYINLGKKILIRNIQDFLQSKIISFVMNMSLITTPIYLIRHGETVNDLKERLGGDSDLTENGIKFTKYLEQFLKDQLKYHKYEDIIAFCSTMKPSVQTIKNTNLNFKTFSLKNLDELSYGLCTGLTLEEIEKKFPNLYESRENDPLKHRFQRGENYFDLLYRLDHIFFDIERSTHPIIIVAGDTVLKSIYAYFVKNEIKEIEYIDLPLNTVIKLTPDVYFCNERRFEINLETGKISEEEIKNVTMIPVYEYEIASPKRKKAVLFGKK